MGFDSREGICNVIMQTYLEAVTAPSSTGAVISCSCCLSVTLCVCPVCTAETSLCSEPEHEAAKHLPTVLSPANLDALAGFLWMF